MIGPRVGASLIALGIFAVGCVAGRAWGAPVELSSDPFHVECIEEHQLDNPAVWAKGGRVPPTCQPEDAPLDFEMLEHAWGKPLDRQERVGVILRFDRYHGDLPGVGLDKPGDSPAPVPLPGAAWLMLAGLAAICGWRKYTHRLSWSGGKSERTKGEQA